MCGSPLGVNFSKTRARTSLRTKCPKDFNAPTGDEPSVEKASTQLRFRGRLFWREEYLYLVTAVGNKKWER